jgi:hypothetical protein
MNFHRRYLWEAIEAGNLSVSIAIRPEIRIRR